MGGYTGRKKQRTSLDSQSWRRHLRLDVPGSSVADLAIGEPGTASASTVIGYRSSVDERTARWQVGVDWRGRW
eukprot:361221-Chlamydomonas_euryale.AAC.4